MIRATSCMYCGSEGHNSQACPGRDSRWLRMALALCLVVLTGCSCDDGPGLLAQTRDMTWQQAVVIAVFILACAAPWRRS